MGLRSPGRVDNARHARAHGLFKTIIEGIDRIERAQLRGAGIGLLVNIIAFKAERILADANVRVRIDKSWQKPGASRVDHLAYRKLWELLHRPLRRFILLGIDEPSSTTGPEIG